MKVWLIGILIISRAHAIPIPAHQVANPLLMTPQTVRVKLSHLGHVMLIKGTDLALSLAKKPELGSVRGGGLSDQWMVDCKRSLIIDPLSGRSRQLPRTGVLIESASGILSVNERRFRDQIVVYPQDVERSNAECVVINHLHIEKYLESVVNAEFNSQWAQGAVEAQIIAARSYALYQMREMRKDPTRVYDLESTQKDQVYLGLDSADSKATQLVAKTRGLILVSKTNKKLDPIKAFYHASCGGLTTLPERVWGSKIVGFTRGVSCPYCAGSPSFHWELQISLSELAIKIKHALPNPMVQHWTQYQLVDVKTSGLPAAAGQIKDRVQDLFFHFAKLDRFGVKTNERVEIKMDAYQARNAIDPAKLKSTWFAIERFGTQVQFKGLGSGHGVGMCQWGAKKMGDKGFNRDQILAQYYPGVKIARVW